MKIAISSTGRDMNSQIDQRFGRCAYFIIQTDDASFEVFEKEFKSLGGGAGIQAAGFLQSKDVKAILTGNCGPNAMNVFSEAKIQVVTGQAGIIKEVIEQFKQGKLTPSAGPTVNEKAGLADADSQGNLEFQGKKGCMGGGGGRGMGGGGRGRGIAGGGRGMGGGGGAGMGGGKGSGRGMGRRQV
jgi:predicted Fe-Mo cluster-binding NifX family protein